MSEKGLYKKAVDSWSDDVKFAPRAKENKMFEQNANDKVGARKKSQKKGTPRSNHKHDYQPIIVWRKSIFSNKIYSHVSFRCNICGKIESGHFSVFGGKNKEKYYGELEHFWANEKDELTPIDSTTYQKVVFIGGSKIITTLEEKIKNTLVEFMNYGHNFIIGDCMGADLQVQKLLSENSYSKVTVYYSGNTPRVNLGNWKTKHVSSNKYMSGYESQKLKDIQMANDCDFGYMLLKGETKGTMANIEELIKLNKKCEVILTEYNGLFPYSFSVEDERGVERIKWCYERANKR